MKPATFALAGLGLLAAFAVVAHQQATAANDAAAADEAAPVADSAWNSFDLWGMTSASIQGRQLMNVVQNPNAIAFLDMLAHAEGTDRADDEYRVCYAYRYTIKSLSDHPAITGEWQGESIANLGPQYAGKVSTAAGRYQIIRKTWSGCKQALGLADFSPASQDMAALYLIKSRGALDAVIAGDVEAAIFKCRSEWASLPGGGSGQPQRKLAELLDAYTQNGGKLA